MSALLLDVQHLTTSFSVGDRNLMAVQDVSFSVHKATTVALVGESGCGKSVTALSILGLIQSPPGHIDTGQVLFNGRDLLTLDDKALRKVRGNRIAMIFQEPMTSLNPVFTVGFQVAEGLILHQRLNRSLARKRTVELLQAVGIPAPEQRIDAYPHQLSGGMRQRVMIAMALACSPDLLIADEPTTALDVTIQAQILELLSQLQKQFNMSVLLITHDLGIVAQHAEEVIVMYAGRVVETASVSNLFKMPMHPYTAGLLASVPAYALTRKAAQYLCGCPQSKESFRHPDNFPKGADFPSVAVGACKWALPASDVVARNRIFARSHRIAAFGATFRWRKWVEPTNSALQPLIECRGLTKHFSLSRGLFGKHRIVRAVQDVTLHIERGETLGLVGESGCGKSTLGRTLLLLIPPTSGSVIVDGRNLSDLNDRQIRPWRRRMQIVFQDPYSSLDPRMTVQQLIAEPLCINRIGASVMERREIVTELLQQVGLHSDALSRYPHEFSGGQRQRIGIARALAVKPDFIVCDEPLSALDVSIQAQIVNLLLDLRDKLGIGYLFISHDLDVVRFVSQRIAVMYLGHILEVGTTKDITQSPRHPYTHALLNAIPIPDPKKRKLVTLLGGDVPNPVDPPTGCSFHPRCSRIIPGQCDSEAPPLVPGDSGHRVACWNPIDLA